MLNGHHLICYDFEMNRLSSGIRFTFINHVTTATRSLGALNLFQSRSFFLPAVSIIGEHTEEPNLLKSFKMKRKSLFHNASTNKSVAGRMLLESNAAYGPPAVHAETERYVTGRDSVWGGGLCPLKPNPIPLRNSPNLLFSPD